MIPRRVMLFSVLLLVLVVSASSAWAQFTSGIEGTVTDPTGAVLSGATVTIKSEDTGSSQTFQTGDSGSFRFTTLPSSTFTVTASAQGFKTTVQEHVRLNVAETKTLNIRMVVGGTESTVTVTDEAPAVETAQARVSGQVSEKEVHDLPLSGRNFYTLVVLTPGVTGLASGGGQAYAQASGDIFNPEYGVNLSANGSRAESNSFLIDSASIDSSQRNGVTNVNPNAEDVQEVRVAANNFSSEFGRNGAALVNIITKQGSNKWHGTLGFYHTDNKLQAANEFQTAGVPVFRRNEGAWSFGGPIRKDHTFFFASMDILKSGVATGRNATILTPDFINFMQANFPNNISTFVAKSFPASITPTGGFTTAGTMNGTDCSTLPSPSDPITTEVGSIPCNLNVTGVGSFATGLPRNGFQYTGRLDHSMNNNKDRFFVTFNKTTLHQVLFGAPFVYPAFNTIEPTYSEHFALGWVHAAGNLVNEFGFATTRPFGEAKVNHPEVPGITVLGIEGYQTGWGPNAFVQNNFEWRDVASFTHGSHNLKVGGNVTRGRADHESSRVYNRPEFQFNSVFDFATDKANSESQFGLSVRGGFGIFYDKPSEQLYNDYFTNSPKFALGSACAQCGTNQPLFALGTTSDPPYNYPLPPGIQPGLLPSGGLISGQANVTVTDRNMGPSYMENWFFGVQRAVTSTTVAEVDYIGSVGRHLYAKYNVNRFAGDLIQNGGNFTGLAPGFGAINYGQDSENSGYNGFTASVKQRASHGVTLNAAYTFSKAIDQASKLDGSEHVDAFNDSLSRGLADFDVRHRLAFTTLWNLPSPHGSGFRNKLLGGWELTNVTILQSGPPFSVICTANFKPVLDGAGAVVGNTGCDYNADGTNYERPNTPSFGNTKTGLSRSDYLSGIFTCGGTAFCGSIFPSPGLTEGNLGRNTFHGPGFANTDFSVIKNVKIPWFIGGEGANLQFRTEFFNVFNRVNLTQVGTDIANLSNFGKSTSTYPARDIQFALRIAF